MKENIEPRGSKSAAEHLSDLSFSQVLVPQCSLLKVLLTQNPASSHNSLVDAFIYYYLILGVPHHIKSFITH